MTLRPLTLVAIIVSMVAGVAFGVLVHQLRTLTVAEASPFRVVTQTVRPHQGALRRIGFGRAVD